MLFSDFQSHIITIGEFIYQTYSHQGENLKAYTFYLNSLLNSCRSYVSKFSVIALTVRNLDINPIGTFNPLSTKGEQNIKPSLGMSFD